MSERPYGRVYHEIWDDEDVRGLSHANFRLFIFLFTKGHWSCIHEKSERSLKRGAALTLTEVRAALPELQAAGLIEWDEDAEVVWVVNGLEYQMLGNGWNRNLEKNLDRHLQGLPASPLIARFRARYADKVGPGPKKAVSNRSDENPESSTEAVPNRSDKAVGDRSTKAVGDRFQKRSPTTSTSTSTVTGTATGTSTLPRAREDAASGPMCSAGAWTALRQRLLELGHPTEPGRAVSWPGGSGPREWPQVFDQWGGLRGVLGWVERWHAHLGQGRGDPSWWAPKAFTQAAFERLVADVERWDSGDFSEPDRGRRRGKRQGHTEPDGPKYTGDEIPAG